MKILNNISIKILSVLAALLLWVFVVGVENYVFALPIEQSVKVNNLGQNVSVANEINKVKIKYKTDDNSSAPPTAAEFELSVDATNLSEGQHFLPINFISKNPKVTVVAVEPANLELFLEANTSKEITLKNEMKGSPAKDYELKEVKLDINKVKVLGAASVVAKLSDLNLKINLDGSENADFSRKITLEAPTDWNLKGKTVTFEPATVQADIKIRKKNVTESENTANEIKPVAKDSDLINEANSVKKTVMAQIIIDGDNASSVKEILPQNLLITVEGGPEINNQVNNNTIKLDLNLDEVSRGSYQVKLEDLKWENNLDLKVVEFSPEKILVKF